MVSGIASGRQIVYLDMITFSAWNLSDIQRQVISINFQYIYQSVFNISIQPYSRIKAKTHARNPIRLVQSHMTKMRSYGAVVLVFFQFGKQKISLYPQLALKRNLLLIKGNVEI